MVNYFIVDGGIGGIIKNTSNGTAGSYQIGSSGVFMIGTGNKLRNMWIQHIYDNIDTNGPPYDDYGGDSADFIVGGTNTSVCNNEFDDARIGVSMAPADSGVGGTGTQAICQENGTLTGFNLYLNTTNEHVWDFLVNGSGNLYLYANHITGSHANWINPHDSSPPYNNNYHQDGFISFGVDSTGNTVNTVYVFNNTCDAYVTPGANSSGCFFPTSGGPIPNHKNGTIFYAFNNLDMPNGWPTMDIGNNNEFDITSTSISGNVMTLNGFGNVDDGDTIYWSGLTGTASFLNGTSSTVSTCTPCTNGKYSVSTSITIAYTHSNYSTSSETGKGVIDVVQTYMYNNTFYGGNLNYLGTGAGITTMESNIDYFDLGGTSSAQDFYWYDDIAIANPLSSFVTFDYNMYGPITGNAYPTPDHDWFWGSGGAINSFSAWKVYCGCDSHAQNLQTAGALNLSASFRPTDTTLLYAPNLSSSCLAGGPWAYLCYDHPAVVGKGGDTIGYPRPASGSWYVGAFMPAPATNVYVTPSGTAVGNCPAGTSTAPNLTPTQFSNASYWGYGTSLIGAGTKVLFCGTFTASVQATLFTVQGGGTSLQPIWLIADTNAVFQSGDMAYAFYLNGFNYVIIDGGANGVIQNTSMGTGLANQMSGATTGIFVQGQFLKVRNWTIQNMYLNLGAGPQVTCSNNYSPNCDVYGAGSTDIAVNDGFVPAAESRNVEVCNNYLGEASIGIQWNTPQDPPGGEGTQATCQSNSILQGDNIYLNSFNHHHWDGSIGGSGLGPWIYANNFTSDHTQWSNPHDNGESYSYHQDGLIMFGYQNDVPSLNQPVIFYNLFNINFGLYSNGTGEVFCAVGVGAVGSGDACTVFNNLFTVNGYGAEPINTNGQQGFYGNTIQITSNVVTITGPGSYTVEGGAPWKPDSQWMYKCYILKRTDANHLYSIGVICTVYRHDRSFHSCELRPNVRHLSGAHQSERSRLFLEQHILQHPWRGGWRVW